MNTPDEAAILAIERPHKSLWTYYLLACIAIPPLFPFVIIPAYFRFHTMRYRFTSEGISMRWGVLFRREIIVNYARIQDIHLRSNIVERWLGLARILIQTASGSSSAEMTLEGIPQFEAVRDYLYDRMRGVKDHGHKPAASNAPQAGGDDNTELALLLREVASELRAVRQQLEARK
ncbi:MAG TPA: PH domain-containing protein [Opitutaceae bacterium]|nr:PH domain-containing protein [Opitutaceae bacterium]